MPRISSAEKVIMVLYACASLALGWVSIPQLAKRLLSSRSIGLHVSHAVSMASAFVCLLGACLAWSILPAPACALFTLGCACMSALLICDLRARLLPTELVALLLALSVAFRLSVGSVQELLAVACPACVIAALLMAGNYVCTKAGKPEQLGAGDIRMILPLAVFSGAAGAPIGLMACSLIMGAIALACVIRTGGGRVAHVAMAPGLTAWVLVGTVIPFI